VFSPLYGEQTTSSEQEKVVEYEPDEIVVPMLRVYDAPFGNHLGWAVYYTGKLEDGKCFFIEWDYEVEAVEDLGINMLTLAELISGYRNHLPEEGQYVTCTPMRIYESDKVFYMSYEWGEDLTPVCDVEYPCPGRSFPQELPNVANAKFHELKDFLPAHPEIECSIGYFMGFDEYCYIWEATWTRDSPYSVPVRNYIADENGTAIIESNIIYGWRHSDDYNPAYFFGEVFSSAGLSCWDQYYETNEKTVYGYCPDLESMGFWENNEIGTGTDCRLIMMFSWAKDTNEIFEYYDFSDLIADDYGDYARYDPELDTFFTCRCYGRGHYLHEHTIIEKMRCSEDSFLAAQEPYFIVSEDSYSGEHGFSVGGDLKLNDEVVLATFGTNLAASGNDRDFTYLHDETYSSVKIINGGNHIFLSDKKKDEEYYHSACFGEACCGIDDVSFDDDYPTVYCGAIVFKSSENPGGTEASFLVFNNIQHDYQAYWQYSFSFGVNGVWVPLNIGGDTSKYVILTSRKITFDLYNPLGYWATSDRFVVKYKLE
jgi:hypothetical protein